MGSWVVFLRSLNGSHFGEDENKQHIYGKFEGLWASTIFLYSF